MCWIGHMGLRPMLV